jgi:hypothetical protein
LEQDTRVLVVKPIERLDVAAAQPRNRVAISHTGFQNHGLGLGQNGRVSLAIEHIQMNARRTKPLR